VTPTLHLILGPTGLGKTRIAVALAAGEGSCPVVALDRFQGCREIAIGSGRPSEGELAGTTRLYLSDGPLAAGPVSASAAANQLHIMLRSFLEDGVDALVMEGGSVSLLAHMAADTHWAAGWSLRIKVCAEASARRYEAQVAQRVEGMLGYGARPAGARTLLHELGDLWDDPQARKHASGVLGYQEAIDWCESHGLSPQDLTGRHGYLWRHELARSITVGHLAYARQQRRALAVALPALDDIAGAVGLCEVV
jgi:hypothetical protein